MNKGEKDKFQIWWKEVSPMLLSRASAVISGDAADIVQDTGVLALRNWEKFKDAEYIDFVRWCQIRTRYLILDELRKRKSKLQRDFSKDLESVPSPPDNTTELDFLASLVERLPQKQGDVVRYVLQGYTTSEISEFMDISSRTVRSNWRHAQVKLANIWDKES